jgi:hypothetical protein
LFSLKQSIGSIKLQFFDEHNNKFIVTRSMEARILKSKMDFKTIDGTISIVQPDGTVCYQILFSTNDIVYIVIFVGFS